MTSLNPTYVQLLLLALAFLLAAAGLALWRFLDNREARRQSDAAQAARRKMDAYHRQTPAALRIDMGPEDGFGALRRDVTAWADEHARRSA